MEKQIILKYLKQYLDKHKIEYTKCGVNMIALKKCIFCGKEFSATQIPNNPKIACKNPICKKRYTIIEIARKIENLTGTDEEILHHIKEDLCINVVTSIDQKNINELLEFYKENNFDLVPIVKNKKYPIEKNWTNREHKDIEEWQRWILDGFNIGIKTGIRSRITILDIDQKPIPEEIKKIMGKTLIQESTHGYHLFYKYEEDFPKTRIDEFKIDLENDGGQVVIAPSRVEGIARKLQINSIIEMPKELKKLIKSKMTVPKRTFSENLREDIETENFKINPKDLQLKNNNLEGVCNSSFIKLGGIFRKQLNTKQTGYVLHVLNKHLLENPMPSKSINAMLRELEKYDSFDEKELANIVLEHLMIIEEGNASEISNALVGTNRGEDRKRVDNILSYLVKEEKIKKNRKIYSIIKKANWKTNLINIGIPIDFKMPYFEDIMAFNWGDLILIGSKNAAGKTHISMNIIKQLVNQGKTPYYLSLESGSRWSKIALQLGLKEGDFMWDEVSDATKIELENGGITIIDWLCPNNYAEVDKLLKHFTEKLQKTKGIAIVFMQLRDNNDWLAKDLVKQFPSFACRYVYSDDDTGEYGKYIIDKIREAKFKTKVYEVPCRYDWETKELKMVEEILEEENKEKPVPPKGRLIKDGKKKNESNKENKT